MRLILLDADAIIHRAYHAMPRSFIDSKNQLINAVYGFFSIFLKIANELKPDYLAAAFDRPEPTFREKQFEEYKAQRLKNPQELTDQIKSVQKALAAIGVNWFDFPGFEADDIIGTIAAQAEKLKEIKEIIIVTGDLDTLQLVTTKTKVYTMKKGMSDTLIYDEKAVKERYGFGPELIPDYKALAGDPSDNIPGVRGIGEKSAKELIKKFGPIENILKTVQNQPKAGRPRAEIKEALAKKLVASHKEARFSKILATIQKNMPIDFELKKAKFNPEILENFLKYFQPLGFKKLVQRAKDILGKKELEERPQREIQLNFETKTKKDETYFIKKESKIYLGQADKVVELKEFKNLDSFSKPIAFDTKEILKEFLKRGLNIKPFDFDIKIAFWLLAPDFSNYGLSQAIKRFLRVELPENINSEQEFEIIKKLKEVLTRELKEKGLEKVFYSIELPLTPVLAEMEQIGIKINAKKLKEFSQELNNQVIVLENKIYKLFGEKFNLNSPQQLGLFLFEKLKLPTKGIKKTPTGVYSTQESELEKLKGEHEAVKELLELRKLTKLKSTYTESLLRFADKDSKIHTNFIQTGTATGRLASASPNLQNIPLQGELGGKIREVFEPEKNFNFISFDYSQLELRILASLSGDEEMLSAFKKDTDIHTLTASRVLGVPLEKISKKERFNAKALNFGLMYGMGPRAFSQQTGLKLSEAKEFIEKYFREFAGVRKFLDELIEKSSVLGYSETQTGRKRFLGLGQSFNTQFERRLERMAMNMPIQGLEADIIKMAMIEIQKTIKEKGWQNKVKMVLQVHDELLFEISEDSNFEKESISTIKKIMESVYDLRAKLKVEVEKGKDFYNLKAWPSSEPR